MPSKTSITALIHLSRYKEYILFVVIISLLGFVFSNTGLSRDTFITLVLALTANLLAVCFSFMINDIEDAPDDALNPDKINRNPVSAGRLSRRRALAATGLVGVSSAVVYGMIGFIPFILGCLTLIIGGLYSWKMVRLKNIPIFDIVSHSLMLGGLLFLCSYSSFQFINSFSINWIIPLLFVTSISAYGELANEVRDLTYDKKAGLTHTAVYVGKSIAEKLMYGFLSIAVICLLYALLMNLVPFWMILTTSTFAVVFCIPLLIYELPQDIVLKKGKIEEAIYMASIISIFLWIVLRTFN